MCDGLSLLPLIMTRPFLHASIAMERVLYMRAAQSHLSNLASAIVGMFLRYCRKFLALLVLFS